MLMLFAYTQFLYLMWVLFYKKKYSEVYSSSEYACRLLALSGFKCYTCPAAWWVNAYNLISS